MVAMDVDVGSPARAGIDPGFWDTRAFSIGFPRTGGDRPLMARFTVSVLEVPPHGRG